MRSGRAAWMTAACLLPYLLATPALAAEGHGGGPSPTVLFFVQVGLLLIVGRLFGEIAQRLGQPGVMGQLIGGIVLGPSILGLIWPEMQHTIFPVKASERQMLDGVAQLGVLMLLLLTGMETDFGLVKRVKRASALVSLSGIAIPFACGVGVGWLIPDWMLPHPEKRLVTALFLGTALSISSVKIVAMVIRDMEFTRRNLGQIILAAAIIDDTVGWIIIGIVLGIPLGVWAAVYRNSVLDHVMRVLGLVGYSVPIFWLGIMGLLVFYLDLQWVGGPGRVDVYFEGEVPTVTGLILVDSLLAGDWDVFNNALSHIILPATLLGYYSLAYVSRMTRSLMLEQLNQEYLITARVKGVSERRIVWRHAFGNILVALITVCALAFANILEGSVLTETVFAWPGIGRYITTALFSADMNSVLGGTIVVGTVYVGVNLLSDILYRIVDPRAR